MRWLVAGLVLSATFVLGLSAVCGEPPAIVLHPGDDIAGLVDRAPEGSRFRFVAGVYRGVEIAPKDDDSFVGEPGAILSGAQIVSGFAASGGAWVGAVDVGPRSPHGDCRRGRLCTLANDVFIGGVRQEPAGAVGGLSPGRVFLDHAARRLYLGTDPAGRTVELAIARFAFAGAATHVRIAGLVFENYANAAQSGVIGGSGRPAHWTIENCEIRDNHGVGIEIGADTVVAHNFIHDNGQLGIAGGDSHPLITDNDIADNNQAGFDTAWEAGGIKLTRAIHASLKGNFVHGNHGPGMWTDMDSMGTEYSGNRIENNDGAGIHEEISFDGVIRDNQVRGNGRVPHSWIWGSQILVANSRNETVANNRIGVPDGGTGIILVEQVRDDSQFGPHVVRDCLVTGNTVEMTGETGIAAGIVTDYAASRADHGGNRFVDDVYRVPDANGRFWAWPSWHANIGFADFQKYGQEPAGTIRAASPG